MDIFSSLQEIVINRRTIKPGSFSGRKIDDAQIRELLKLANWAPSHGLTEPWRFIVYSGEAVGQFCHQHAELYRQTAPPSTFTEAKYEKQAHNGDLASHLIIVYMQRGTNPNIAGLEEICATAAAADNILLGAEALGIAVQWSTGGVVLQPVMKEYLGLGKEDIILGLLYLGYTDEPVRPGKRTPITEKTKWITAL